MGPSSSRAGPCSGGREAALLFGGAAGGAGERLRLPVYIARGFVAISGPSRDAVFGVGRPSARRGCPCLMALQ